MTRHVLKRPKAPRPKKRKGMRVHTASKLHAKYHGHDHRPEPKSNKPEDKK